MKTCRMCGVTKPKTEYSPQLRPKYKTDGLHPYCKPCRVVYNRSVCKATPAMKTKASKKSKLKNKYGLTFEEVEAQMVRQGSRCCICSADLRPLSKQSVHVDHCHSTGTNRGILCGNCNMGLGSFKDNKAVMKIAIAYLESCGKWSRDGESQGPKPDEKYYPI